MRMPSSLRVIAANTALALVLSLIGARPAGATDVNGSGSTFVYPVMLRWAASYYAKTKVKVNYQAIGSGGGVHQVKADLVTFAASDKPLAPEELHVSGLAQFPLVIGGVVPVINLEGVKPGQLNVTGELLADVYLGKITRWSDPAIAALNPEAKLPDLKITVVHRSDSSGTTFNWVNYLSKVSPAWRASVGEGTVVKWPIGTAGGGSEGIARYVNYIKGSIGYVELAYAISHGMTYTKVKNKAGVFVAPSLESFQAAAAGAEWKAADFYELLTDAPGKDAWPIAATVFVMMPREPHDTARAAEALRFFGWSLEHGQAEAKALNYVALPESLVKRVQEYWISTVKTDAPR